MQAHRTCARLFLLASLVVGACTEQTPPTGIAAGVNAAVSAAAGANNQKVKVKTLQLGSNTLRINGPSVSGNVTIGNSGLAIPSNVVMRAEITQGAASRQAVNMPTQCSSTPGDAGKLPTGSCDMTFTASASNLASGSGTLSAGSATFTLHVIQTSNAGDTELASKSVLVNLVEAPGMTVTIAPTAVLIDGAAATATAVIQNPANSLQGMLVQGWIVQGNAPNQTRRPTGGSLVTCGSNAGVLPPGTCTMTISVSASNVGPGTGLFASGPATFELDLIQTSGSLNTTLDVKTAAITLVWASPHLTRVALASTTLAIGGAAVDYAVDIQNGGAVQPNVVLIAQIHQFTSGGTIVKQADGLAVTCGGPPGELPTTGTGVCTIESHINALGDSNGGALTPGAAVLFLDLIGDSRELDRQQVNITLVGMGASIGGVRLPRDYALGSVTGITATLQNTGPALQGVVFRSAISQGTARRETGERQVQCPGRPVGELPTDGCTLAATVFAMNAPNAGTGTLIPGPATLELDLDQTSGGTTTNLDTRLIPINLVMSAPGIIGIALSAPNVLIGESIEYTATLYNPTNATISSAFIQGYLSQESIVDFGAGGTDLLCSGAGEAELPPGVCQVTFTLGTRNSNGAPAWAPGEATFRLELIAGSTLLDSKSVTVFLNIIQ